jgi:hypothetical protein
MNIIDPDVDIIDLQQLHGQILHYLADIRSGFFVLCGDRAPRGTDPRGGQDAGSGDPARKRSVSKSFM